MHILHTVAHYYPDTAKIGGIQVNLKQLCRVMLARGHVTEVAGSRDAAEDMNLEDSGTSVYRYPVFPEPSREPTHGRFPHANFELFRRWLELPRPLRDTVYHQHQWTPKCGYRHLLAAKRAGYKAAVSIHVPLPLCQKGTLIRAGEQCDGEIIIERCIGCCAGSRETSQFPRSQALSVAAPLTFVRDLAGSRGFSNSYVDSFFLAHFIKSRKRSLRELADLADTVIVSADWLHQALLANGFPERKIRTCRYGIEVDQPSRPKQVTAAEKLGRRTIKFCLMGRWTEHKGMHIAVEAFRKCADHTNIRLDIYGTPQDPAYEQRIRSLAASDKRIAIHSQVDTRTIHDLLANYHALIVPSQWLETGPLVALHAFAAGIPVLGSNLGGLRELVRDGLDGLLIHADSSDAWSAVFQRLSSDERIIDRLRKGVKSPFTVVEQADQLLSIYREMLETP